MISKALSELLHMIQMETIQASAQNTGTRKTMYAAKIGQRVFRKAGIPAGSTAADDPGANFSIIIDTTNNDLYFISAWVPNNDAGATKALSTSFTSTKILD
jgi:hypothetical protein